MGDEKSDYIIRPKCTYYVLHVCVYNILQVFELIDCL